jgi:alkylation response protein AidB-like acyl-CoA dehydrogenase
MYPLIGERHSEWIRTTAEGLADLAALHQEELVLATKEGVFLKEIYREMGRQGWVGSVTPVEWGGSGLGVTAYCVIEEECARRGLVSPQISVQGQLWLTSHGTDEQCKRYLPTMARGELIFCESISEPGSGSSLRNLDSSAVRKGDQWIINGHKIHVNLGAQADVSLVFTGTEYGLTAFLVDLDQDGIERRRTEPVGLRLLPTAEITFHDVVVSAGSILGQPGGGMATFLSTFNISRLGNASMLLGTGRRAMTLGIDYAQRRRVGDSLVADFQGIQWTIADTYALLYAAALARDRAALIAHGGGDCSLETSLAKNLAIKAAEQATNEVFALIGGHGLYLEEQYMQLLADVKVLRIAGGSVEVLRNYIARRILKSVALEGLR